MGCSDSSVLLKIAVVVLPLAVILHVVGLATSEWSSMSAFNGRETVSMSFGLWKMCATKGYQSECIAYPTVLDWVKSCRAFAIIGMVAVVAAAILELLCTVALSKTAHKMAYILAALTAFIGAATIIISGIIWSTKVSDLAKQDQVQLDLDLSWSFVLSIVGGVLSGIGGVLVSIDLCQ